MYVYLVIFIGMVNITISILALVILIGTIMILTWWVSEWWFYRRHEGDIVKMEKCSFKTSCVRYDEIETKTAVKRVAKLILKNIESEELEKKKLYEDLASGKIG